MKKYAVIIVWNCGTCIGFDVTDRRIAHELVLNVDKE